MPSIRNVGGVGPQPFFVCASHFKRSNQWKRHGHVNMFIYLFIYLFIYMLRRTTFSARASNRKEGELSFSHFYNSNHWKRTLKMIFKGSGCFQFPEAVFASTAKKAYALQNGDHYKL